MPYLLVIFAAGILVGRNWDAIKRAVAPVTGGAAAKFDEFYSDAARKMGTKVEDFEDHLAKTRQHARGNGL